MRSDGEMMGKKMRTAKGCWEAFPKVIHHIGEIGFKRCIGNYTSEGIYSWVEAHSLYEKGVLPFPGALMDQPNKVIEIFQCIASAKHEKMEADRKAAELKNHGR